MKNLFPALKKGIRRGVRLIVDLELPRACGYALRH